MSHSPSVGVKIDINIEQERGYQNAYHSLEDKVKSYMEVARHGQENEHEMKYLKTLYCKIICNQRLVARHQELLDILEPFMLKNFPDDVDTLHVLNKLESV